MSLFESEKTLTYDSSSRDGVTVIAINGRLIISKVDELDLFFNQLLHQHGKYVLDLRELTHVVSSGIGVLIAFRERVIQSEGTLAVGGVNPRIMKIFKLMSLDAFFPFYDEVDDAISSLAG